MPGRKSKVAGTNFESRVVRCIKEAGYMAKRTTSGLQSRNEVNYDVDVDDPPLAIECKYAGHRKGGKSIRIDLHDLAESDRKKADVLAVNSAQGPLAVLPIGRLLDLIRERG